MNHPPHQLRLVAAKDGPTEGGGDRRKPECRGGVGEAAVDQAFEGVLVHHHVCLHPPPPNGGSVQRPKLVAQRLAQFNRGGGDGRGLLAHRVANALGGGGSQAVGDEEFHERVARRVQRLRHAKDAEPIPHRALAVALVGRDAGVGGKEITNLAILRNARQHHLDHQRRITGGHLGLGDLPVPRCSCGPRP